MKISNLLPGKRDKRWLMYIPLLMILIISVLSALACGILKISIHSSDLVLFAVLAFLASASICGFSYAGLYIAAVSCLTGLAAGILFMAYVFTQPVQWAGIVGLVSGAQLAFIFFLTGVCAQMLYYLSKKRRRSYGGK